MEVLSSLRNAVGNPLPRGHGNENGDTCWMALSATEKKQKEQSFSLLIYRVLVYFSYQFRYNNAQSKEIVNTPAKVSQ